MNLLIIGNGFDLAHGLPTRYTDFLIYCRDYDKNTHISKSNELNEEFISFVKDNVWLKYFLNSTIDINSSKTWIDFEKQLAEVIWNIDLANLKIEQVHYLNAPSEVTVEFSSNSNSKIIELFISPICAYDERTRKFVITINSITDTDSFIDFVYQQVSVKQLTAIFFDKSKSSFYFNALYHFYRFPLMNLSRSELTGRCFDKFISLCFLLSPTDEGKEQVVHFHPSQVISIA